MLTRQSLPSFLYKYISVVRQSIWWSFSITVRNKTPFIHKIFLLLERQMDGFPLHYREGETERLANMKNLRKDRSKNLSKKTASDSVYLLYVQTFFNWPLGH